MSSSSDGAVLPIRTSCQIRESQRLCDIPDAGGGAMNDLMSLRRPAMEAAAQDCFVSSRVMESK